MKAARLVFCSFFISFLFSPQIQAQVPGVNAEAKGKGQTTGHIADLTFTNTTDQSIDIDMDKILIPSSGEYQGYVIPEGIEITIPPNSTVTVPLNGYCTDIHLPPVSAGEPMPPFDTWITPTTAGPAPSPGFEPPSGSAFEPVTADPNNPYVPTYPGTETSFPYSIDFNKNPTEAAPIIFEVIENITKTVEEMYDNGEVPTTPFSGNPEKEKEALIQQTLWIYTSILMPDDGKRYGKEDFSDRTVEQFTETTGIDLSTAPPAAQEQISQGVDQFWSSFEAVGVKAKILKKNDPSGIPPSVSIICPQPGDYVSPEGFEMSWELTNADGSVITEGQTYSIDIQPLTSETDATTIEGVTRASYQMPGLDEGQCYNISVSTTYNGINIGNIPFAICVDNITLDSLIRLVQRLGEEVAEAAGELESNSLVQEARLIQMIMELLSTPDKIWGVLDKWLNTEIDKLINDLTSIDDIGEVIETVELIEKLMDNLARIDPDHARDYRRIKQKCEDIRTHYLEPGKDAQEKFNQLYEELTAMLTDFKGYLGDKAEEYLKEKIETTLRNMLIKKFGMKAAGAMMSAAIDLANFADALIKMGNLNDAKVMYHLLFFEMLKRTYGFPKWKIDNSYNDKEDPPRIVWADCNSVKDKKVTMRAYVVCWEQKEGSDTPGEGKFGEGKPLKFKDGKFEVEKENFTSDCDDECAFKYKLNIEHLKQLAGDCEHAYVYIEARTNGHTFPRVYVGAFKP